MRGILDYIKREPAVLLSLLGAAFAMFAAFGLSLTTEQTAAITAVVVVVLGIVTRQTVTPNVSVAAKVDAAGDVVTGNAAPPAGDPAAVVTSHDGEGLKPEGYASGVRDDA